MKSQSPIQTLLALLLLTATVATHTAPIHAAAPPKVPSEKKLSGLELQALEAMRAKAVELNIHGVATVNFALGDKVQSWTSHMLVVGHMTDPPADADKGNNLLAFAYQKSAEMADTFVDSGTAKRPLLSGELGWQGGVVSEVKLAKASTAHIIVSFSGGKSEEDVQVSKAGLAVMMKGL